MAGDRMQVTTVDMGLIDPNSYNPNVVQADRVAKLQLEIAKKGLIEQSHYNRVRKDSL